MNKDELIKNYYRDPRYGLSSAKKLFEKIKLSRNDITYADVKTALKTQPDYQVMRVQREPKKFGTIYALEPLERVQIDIMDLQRWPYNGYKYILCVIDVYSRFAICRALKSRSGDDIMNAILTIFQELKGIPKNVSADQEFGRGPFKAYADAHHIKLWLSFPNEAHKNAIVERFNGTLARKLQKYRLSTGRSNWVEVLDDVVENYNNSVHSTLKETPKSVFIKAQPNRQVLNFSRLKFNLGDKVRIKIMKSSFDKGDIIRTSYKIYSIDGFIGNRYRLKDILTGNVEKRLYKQYELLKVDKNTPLASATVAQAITKIRELRKAKTINRAIHREGIF